MQISITNGTLTQVEETLVATQGYTLPTTIQVSGATSNYNSTTGNITLTSPTSTMSITAEGVEAIGSISFGSSDVELFVGNTRVSSVFWGNKKVYEASGYEYTQSGDELTITNAPYTLNGDELTIGE